MRKLEGKNRQGEPAANVTNSAAILQAGVIKRYCLCK